MKRAIAFLSLFASAALGFAQQNKDPVTSVVKEILPHQEKNLVAAVAVQVLTEAQVQPPPYGEAAVEYEIEVSSRDIPLTDTFVISISSSDGKLVTRLSAAL
jgi:hypothetical protein